MFIAATFKSLLNSKACYIFQQVCSPPYANQILKFEHSGSDNKTESCCCSTNEHLPSISSSWLNFKFIFKIFMEFQTECKGGGRTIVTTKSALRPDWAHPRVAKNILESNFRSANWQDQCKKYSYQMSTYDLWNHSMRPSWEIVQRMIFLCDTRDRRSNGSAEHWPDLKDRNYLSAKRVHTVLKPVKVCGWARDSSFSHMF